jgi:glycine oxidase
MARVLTTGELPDEALPFTPRRFGAPVLAEQSV